MKLMTRQPVNNNRHFEGNLEASKTCKLVLDMSPPVVSCRPKEGRPRK